MQTKRQLKRCTRNVHPSFADFRPGLGVNFHILLTQNWLWESSLSLLSLWCILFQIKLGLFRENLNLKKHLGPKNGWSSPSTFWHRLICGETTDSRYIYVMWENYWQHAHTWGNHWQHVHMWGTTDSRCIWLWACGCAKRWSWQPYPCSGSHSVFPATLYWPISDLF